GTSSQRPGTGGADRCLKSANRVVPRPAARRHKPPPTRRFAYRGYPLLTRRRCWSVPPVCPTANGLAWQFTEGGGRIVGGLVAIGGNGTCDRPTVAGHHPAEDAGPIGVDSDGVGPCPSHPEAMLAVAPGLVLHGDHVEDRTAPSASVHAAPDRRDHNRPPGRTTPLNVLERQLLPRASYQAPLPYLSPT